MADFQYPASDLDLPDTLLASLGSFWAATYDGMDTVQSILTGLAAVANQNFDNLNELATAVGRHSIHVLRTERIHALVLSQSKLGDGYGVPFYDADDTYDDGIRYDTAKHTPLFAYPLPGGAVAVPVIVNRLTETSRTLINGIDYVIADGRILFRVDPFTDPLIAQTEVLSDNEVVDRQLSLWLINAQFDRQLVNRQFAYVLGLQPPPVQASKDLINALLDACVDGSAQQHLRNAWSAIVGVPLCRSDGEIVQLVRYEPTRLLIITDKVVYPFDVSALPKVEVGSVVNRGDVLSDALQFFEFNRGQVPSIEDVAGVSLAEGMLIAGFFADLIFRNTAVPLIVTYDTEGNTKISFEIEGFPGDVELFFDAMHQRGLAEGRTLAQLLDLRPVAARTNQPTAMSLPTTINPLAFLCQNVFRSNVILVKLRTSACQGGAGIETAKALRMLIPPQCMCLVLAELTYVDKPITMDGPGDELRPGYLEAVTVFVGNSYAETIGPSSVQENVRLFQIGGRCV